MNAISLLRLEEVIEATRLSRSAIYKLMGRGLFPRPIKLGRSVRWRAKDIEGFFDERAAVAQKQKEIPRQRDPQF